MDDLVTEILGTIETYRQKGRPGVHKQTGLPVSVLALTEPVTGFLWELRIPDHDFHLPPKDIERELGVRNISENYKMPSGLSQQDLQTYTRVLWYAQLKGDLTAEQVNGKMAETLAALQSRNLPLQKLRFDPSDTNKVRDVLAGAASSFNAVDIQNYLDGKNAADMHKDPKSKSLIDKFKAAGARVGWVAAPETLENIDRQYTQQKKTAALMERTMGPD